MCKDDYPPVVRMNSLKCLKVISRLLHVFSLTKEGTLTMCDVAERLKNMGRQEERINAVKFAISLGASEEKILKQYSKEEYEKALALMKS